MTSTSYGSVNSVKKKYHAACIGVKRDREIFIEAFMMPVCAECRDRVQEEFDLKNMLATQSKIFEELQARNKINHELSSRLLEILSLSHVVESVDAQLIKSASAFDKLSKGIDKMKTCTIATEIADALTSIQKTSASVTPAAHATSQLREILKELREVVAGIQRPTFATQNSTTEEERTATAIVNDVSSGSLLEKAAEKLADAEQSTAQRQTEAEVRAVAATIAAVPSVIIQPTEEVPVSETQAKKDQGSSGWRFIGNWRKWKEDWTMYDRKQRLRRLQEKMADKARLFKKRNKQKLQQQNNEKQLELQNQQQLKRQNRLMTQSHQPQPHQQQIHSQPHSHLQQNSYSRPQNQTNLPEHADHAVSQISCNGGSSDRQLLANAKIQFAGPPASTDHPIAGLVVPPASMKFTNFVKGETINPYHGRKTQPAIHPQQLPHNSNVNQQKLTGSSLDPMRPPIVQLTQQSLAGDGRFLRARLRDPKIMNAVRLYLAYLHNAESSVCFNGMTTTSMKMLLSSEGLPTSPTELTKIFIEVHGEYGVSPDAAHEDLQAYRTHLHGERIRQIQLNRESADRFYLPNFRRH